jgi:hypothetical protein
MLKVAHSLNDNYLIVGSVVLILTLLMWDYLKNFFLGIIFAFQYGYLIDKTVVINKKEGKLFNYSSSYFEIFSGDLFRVSRKVKIDSTNDGKLLKASIMNHPVFLMNGDFLFEEELDDNNQFWLCFYFNVMNFNDANIINSFINQSTLKNL